MTSLDLLGKQLTEDPRFDPRLLGELLIVGVSSYTIQQLQSGPKTLEVDLNSWIRFTSPGKYSLVLSSQRVLLLPGCTLIGSPSTKFVALQAEPIQVRVTEADLVWQLTEINRLTQVVQSNSDRNVVTSAIRGLKYLDSPEAAVRLADIVLGDRGAEYQGEIASALLESSQRDVAISRLTMAVQRSTIALPSQTFDLLGKLICIRDFSLGTLPVDEQKLRKEAARRQSLLLAKIEQLKLHRKP